MKKLVASEIPGLQVHPLFSILWLVTPVILFCLAVVNLTYCIDSSHSSHKADSAPIPSVSASTPVLNQAVAIAKDGLDEALCSLDDVQCPEEASVAISKPVTASVVSLIIDQERMETLVQVCKKHKLQGNCAKDLYSIAWQESKFNCKVIGDQGRSRGCFQIQTKMHKVSVAHAEDFAWAADWTLSRMIGNGYPVYRTIAVERHNGWGAIAQRYVSQVLAYANNLKY